jgi:hypothetical protein
MQARFEIVNDHDRFSFRLLDGDAEVLLTGLPNNGKIAVQNEVLQTRSAIRAGDRFVPHTGHDGSHFVVLKGKSGNVLARSPHVADQATLDKLIHRIVAAASAPLLDHART